MNQDQETKLKKKIVKICKRLHSRNMLAAADGNVSYRISNQRILITPSGVAKAFMSWKDMAVVDIEGQCLEGNPSGELSMHLEVYKSTENAKCVVHAHPPNAIAWSLARPELKELPVNILPEVLLATGRVPIVSYARPTTTQMAEKIRGYLPESKVMILSRHGAISWGDNIEEAYRGMERVEHSSEILRLAYSLGSPEPIPDAEFTELTKMRQSIGNINL